MGGYTGQIARIDLTKKEVGFEPTMNYTQRFLGGRGINSWILFNEMDPEVAPLDPGNLLVFGAGPLVGTSVPSSCFISIGAKNVFTGGINFSHAGGHFAPAMKWAGFDHLVISGKAEKPVYLYLHDGKVEILDASHLWGKTVFEYQEIIGNELKKEGLQFAGIGPAGENLVKGSIIITDKTRAAGGGGLGAVMGSKNLKVVLARGTPNIVAAKPKEFKDEVNRVLGKIDRSEYVKSMKEKGSLGSYMLTMNDLCVLPVRNVQDDHWDPAKLERIEYQTQVEGKTTAVKTNERFESCYNCPIQCGFNVYEAKSGPYAGLKLNAYEANTAYTFGTRCDIDDPAAILKIFEQISTLGLDNDTIGVVISWAQDCFDRGILTRDDTDGLDLSWGNSEAVVELVRKIAYREGFGDLLARGVKEASEVIGKGSDYIAIHCKGQDNWDALRALKGWAFGNVVSLRGGRHLDGAPTTEFADLSPELGEELYGVATAGDPTTYEGKGKLVSWTSAFKAVVDSLGVCYYTSLWGSFDLLGPEDYAKLVSAATGQDISADALLEMGRRIYNVEKAFNTIHRGFTRQDDMPPKIFMEEPIKSGKFKGEKLEEAKWNKMLDEFYECNEWDKQTSWQAREILEKLDLHEVFGRLVDCGRVP